MIEEAKAASEGFRIALVAKTSADVRDTMLELGDSSIVKRSPPDFRPIYEPSKRRLTWPNGVIATSFTADEPNLLRGPQHHFAWCDELAAWPDPDTWDQLLFGLRLGDHPRCIVTTTPRPKPLIRAMLEDPGVHVTRGSTFDNSANLSEGALARLRERYEGTTVGAQELFAALLDEAPGALWKRTLIDGGRAKSAPHMARIVVAVDPSITAKEGQSNECGIVAAGRGADRHGYVLADASGVLSPDAWATRAVGLYHDLKADRVVAEGNQGGELVRLVLHGVDPSVPVSIVYASRGKQARAEPVAALYEQGRVHHVGVYTALEDQLCTWVPGDESPDRLDALVWAMTELMIGAAPTVSVDLRGLGGGSSWPR